MVLDAVSNFVRGTTDAAVDSTQTTVSVVDASIFPDPATDGEYNVVIWDVESNPRPDQDPDVEILRVTAIDTGANDLTVDRGQETTAGASHPSGSAVHLSPTAKMFGDIEETFAEFYDDDTQELTADVNNDSVSTDAIHTTPQGARLTLSSTQSVADDTLTTINYDSVERDTDNFADLSSDAITIPSDDYSFARLKVQLRWASASDVDLLKFQKNGGGFGGNAELSYEQPSVFTLPAITSSWVPVSANDSFTVQVRHITGTTVDLDASSRNWFELEAI